MYKILCDGEIFCDSRLEELAIINPTGTVGANAAGTFSFTIAPDHPHYDMIKRKSSIISVYRDSEDEPIFQGICSTESVDFFGQKTLSFEGELTYFNDSVQRQAHYSSRTPRQLLEALVSVHNSQVGANKQFTVGIVTVTGSLTCYTNYESTMTCLKEDLIDDLGGYIRIRYANGVKYIDYLADGARTSNQTIRLGQNLLDYTSNIDNTQIATCIIPLGAKQSTQEVSGLDAYLTIKSAAQDNYHPSGADYVYSQAAVNSFGWISKVVNWDDVTVVSNLLSKAEDYLQNIQFNNVALQVAAVDLAKINDSFDAFRVLDKIRVISEPHGMNRLFLATEYSFNLNSPEADSITLGTNVVSSLSSATAEAVQASKKAATTNFVESAIANATALITGSDGGYVLINRDEDGQPFEILIMDTPSIDTATNVWRWNVNGLGYSSTGYDGTYATAITMDGHIIADYLGGNQIEGLKFVCGGSYSRYPSDYSSSDLTRLHSIITRDIEPTEDDYERYDFNLDGVLDALDAIVLNNLLNGRRDSVDYDTTCTIEAGNYLNVIKMANLSMTPNGIRTKNGKFTNRLIIDGTVFVKTNDSVVEYKDGSTQKITLSGHTFEFINGILVDYR